MNEFLSFRKYITPVAIQVIFWIMVAAAVISGLAAIAQGKVAGLFMLVLGPIMARIYCEVTILAFRAYDVLVQIQKNTAKGEQPAQS